MHSFSREPGSRAQRQAKTEVENRLDSLDYEERKQQSMADANNFGANGLKYGNPFVSGAIGAKFGLRAGAAASGVMTAGQEFLEQQAKEAEQKANQAIDEARQELRDYIDKGFHEKSHDQRDREGAAIDRMDKAQREGLMDA